MVNTQLLDAAIKESGLKKGFICEKLGISRQAFHKKETGKTKVKAAEIYLLKDLLSLSEEKANDIFFA